MVKNTFVIPAISALLIACSGGFSSTDQNPFTNLGSSTGGTDTIDAGSIMETNSGGETSVSMGGSQPQAVGGSPNIGGSEPMGGSAGMNGIAGETAMNGGNTSMGGSGGSPAITEGGSGGMNVISPPGGSAGESTCIPKTCDQIADEAVGGWNTFDDVSAPTACGWASDGCGNAIDCGECQGTNIESNSETNCGDGVTLGFPQEFLQERYGLQYFIEPAANVCDSRCTKKHGTNGGSALADYCEFRDKEYWACPTDIPPVGKTGCDQYEFEGGIRPDDVYYTPWCCDPS